MVPRNIFVFIVFLQTVLLSNGVNANLTDEDYNTLPRLFHLDDYYKCLSQKGGVYCLGKFRLTPQQEPHHLYNLMKKHSEDRYNFNRTYIHRGYCLSMRCLSTEHNNTLRFEKCADTLAQQQGLRAELHELQYCRTHDDVHTVTPPSYEQTLFIQVVYAILVLNVVGTVYDVILGDTPEKNKLLMAWSLPANWKRLTYIHEGGDIHIAALMPLQGIRLVGIALVMYAHARVFHFAMYTYNPRVLEKLTVQSQGVLLANGSILVHSFIMLTSFLTSYQLLVYSQKQPLRLHMLPVCIIKRIIRITPVHMLVVGYASTWWGEVRDGPIISSTIGEYTRVCRRKFWTHFFYVNNIVDKEYICLTPTWYLAVDMHLYILACFLTIIMWKYRRQAIPLYGACFILSMLVISVVCYVNEWSPIIFTTTSENLRNLFHGVESFSHFYVSTWGALPACFLGLFMGHLHFELQEKGIKGNDHKWFMVLHYLAAPLGVIWQINAGKYATTQTSLAFAAIFIALDRFVFFFLLFFLLFGLINIEGPCKRFFGWSRWQIVARLSLAVMLMHWIINMMIAARPTIYGTSTLDGMVDWMATIVITYVLAVPVTVLFEIPMQRFFNTLL